MKLLTKKIKSQLPALYSTENIKKRDKKVICKFFCPWNNWTWYAIEFDGENEFFGYVEGHVEELGYFYLSDLKSIKKFGLGIERDLYFKPCKLGELIDKKHPVVNLGHEDHICDDKDYKCNKCNNELSVGDIEVKSLHPLKVKLFGKTYLIDDKIKKFLKEYKA